MSTTEPTESGTDCVFGYYYMYYMHPMKNLGFDAIGRILSQNETLQFPENTSSKNCFCFFRLQCTLAERSCLPPNTLGQVEVQPRREIEVWPFVHLDAQSLQYQISHIKAPWWVLIIANIKNTFLYYINKGSSINDVKQILRFSDPLPPLSRKNDCFT